VAGLQSALAFLVVLSWRLLCRRHSSPSATEAVPDETPDLPDAALVSPGYAPDATWYEGGSCLLDHSHIS
jgi:hypothetical protein